MIYCTQVSFYLVGEDEESTTGGIAIYKDGKLDGVISGMDGYYWPAKDIVIVEDFKEDWNDISEEIIGIG